MSTMPTGLSAALPLDILRYILTFVGVRHLPAFAAASRHSLAVCLTSTHIPAGGGPPLVPLGEHWKWGHLISSAKLTQMCQATLRHHVTVLSVMASSGHSLTAAHLLSACRALPNLHVLQFRLGSPAGLTHKPMERRLAEAITQLIHLHTLEVVGLTMDPPTAALLRQLPRITDLCVRTEGAPDEVLGVLAAEPAMPLIRRLEVKRSGSEAVLTPVAAALLARFPAMAVFQWHPFADLTWEAHSRLLVSMADRLTTLELLPSRARGWDSSAVVPVLVQCTRLTFLFLWTVHESAEDVQRILAAMPHLTRFSIGARKLPSLSFLALPSLSASLLRLDLVHIVAPMTDLAYVAGLRALQRVELSWPLNAKCPTMREVCDQLATAPLPLPQSPVCSPPSAMGRMGGAAAAVTTGEVEVADHGQASASSTPAEAHGERLPNLVCLTIRPQYQHLRDLHPPGLSTALLRLRDSPV
jgi:hypothetical protein